MNTYQFVMVTLRSLESSKFCSMVTPQGWGVTIEKVHSLNPIVNFIQTDFTSMYAIANRKRLLVVSDSVNAYEEDPNLVFLGCTGEHHPYKLEWVHETVPTAFLAWWIERVKKYLYPFNDCQVWWALDNWVCVQFTRPKLQEFMDCGIPVFVKNPDSPHEKFMRGIVDEE